jgi:hypothetical protein
VLRRGATIAGRVTLPDGAAFGGRAVLLVSEGGERVSVPLAADGTFRGTGFAAGRWRLTIAPTNWGVDASPSFAPTDGSTVDVTAQTGEFRIDARCAPSGAIAVELADPRLPWSGTQNSGEKWRFGAETTAEIRDAAGNRVQFTRGLQRENLFRNLVLPAGKYTLAVAYPSGDVAEEAFEVAVGKTTTVSVGAR